MNEGDAYLIIEFIKKLAEISLYAVLAGILIGVLYLLVKD